MRTSFDSVFSNEWICLFRGKEEVLGVLTELGSGFIKDIHQHDEATDEESRHNVVAPKGVG